MTDTTTRTRAAHDEALADILYRLTEMQGDLVALGSRDAAGLVAMAIGLVLESSVGAMGGIDPITGDDGDDIHVGGGAATNDHGDDAGRRRADGPRPLH